MIQIMPQSIRDEVDQNIRTIVGIIAGECVLDRELGVTGDLVDRNSLVAAERLEAEIIQKIQTREPRAKVISVELTNNAEPGVFHPRIKYEVIDEPA